MSRGSGLGLIALLWLAGPQLVAADDDPPAADVPTESPPSGPAEIIKRAQQKRTPAPDAPSELPAGHPPVAEQAAEQEQAAPVGGDPHAGAPGAPPLERRPIASAEANPSLPPGTVRIRVVDSQTDQPVAGARLQLGTMSRDSNRTTVDAKTSASGEHVFEKLATGEGQAYRANLLVDGAKFSSTPFRLPPNHGYDVLIRRLPTTHETRELVLYVGATSIELRDERLKVVQQARLINIGSKAIVFPEDGVLYKLPKDYKAFQAEEVMTDQHMREEPGQGLKITGSVVPGETTLTWGFDVEHQGADVDLAFELPWTTFAYRVLADAAPGMTIEVEGLPPPQLHEENGRRFLVTEVVKRVGESPLRSLRIHVRGIPGPGPMRIIAAVVAVFLVIGGALLARKPPPAAYARPASEIFEQRKSELVAQAARLAAERERGEIGPEFHAEQLAALEEQMAALLYEHSLEPAAKRSAAA
ncbi:MAG TPA: carboxypeptidase-like regulatory domain-containing protein [Polyangiales bacterium]|nr:carboxypeptidase-like regulatory domain-containing protein [Polyangiales bacterium]